MTWAIIEAIAIEVGAFAAQLLCAIAGFDIPAGLTADGEFGEGLEPVTLTTPPDGRLALKHAT